MWSLSLEPGPGPAVHLLIGSDAVNAMFLIIRHSAPVCGLVTFIHGNWACLFVRPHQGNGHFMTQACVIILLLDRWGMYTTLTLSAVASSLEKVFWNRPMLSLGVYPRSKSKLWDSQVVKYNQREGSKVGDRFPLSSSILNRDANASLFKHGWCHCKI